MLSSIVHTNTFTVDSGYVRTHVLYDSLVFSLSPLALNPTQSPSTWYLKPHPARDQVQIGGLTDPAWVRVYSLDGRLVHQQTLEAGQALPISHLAPGFYQVDVQSQTQQRRLRLLKE